MLQLANEMHLYCLTFVFLPRINRHLQGWKEGWVHHKISTARNQTPMQLYIMGMLRNANSGHRTSNELYEPLTQDEIDEYGIDSRVVISIKEL